MEIERRQSGKKRAVERSLLFHAVNKRRTLADLHKDYGELVRAGMKATLKMGLDPRSVCRSWITISYHLPFSES